MCNPKVDYTVAVYPFTREFVPFLGLEFCHGKKTVHVHKLVSPKGLGLDGKDAGYVDNRGVLGFTVEHDLFAALESCNALFLAEGSYIEGMRSKLFEYAEQAIARGKHILCGIRLELEQMKRLQEKCEQQGVDFVYIPKASADFYEGKPKRMYRPNASVVFVGEIIEGMNGTDVTLALADHFRKGGYRTSAILSSNIASIFGMHAHHEYDAPSRTEEQKIEAMNYAIKHIDTTEAPDVIVLQLPGGMMSLNDTATSQFGIYAYMWSQAASADCFVLCAPFRALQEEKYDELSQHFLQRYGYKVDCIHLCNATVDTRNLMAYFELSFSYVPVTDVVRYIDDHTTKMTIPTFCVLRAQDREKMCMYVESTLRDFGDAKAL